MVQECRVLQEIKQECFVVAFEKNHLRLVVGLDQKIKNLLRGRAAIDIVAEKNCNRLRYWMESDIDLNLQKEWRQKISPTMDVADRVDANPLRHSWGLSVASSGRQLPHGIERSLSPGNCKWQQT